MIQVESCQEKGPLVTYTMVFKLTNKWTYDKSTQVGVMTWKRFPHYYPFVEQWPVTDPQNLLLTWTNCWPNRLDANDFKRINVHLTSLHFGPSCKAHVKGIDHACVASFACVLQDGQKLRIFL